VLPETLYRLPRQALLLGAFALVGGLALVALFLAREPLSEPVEEPVAEAELPSGVIRIVGDPEARGLTLHLPTSNDNLLRDARPEFYMGLDATVPGLRPERWMGGQYGFVRNVANTPAGPTFTRVHQGIDIRPLFRDGQGVPLDTVRVIGPGTVAHVNASAGGSNYGRYVVVRHPWDGSDVYTLSAHLATVSVERGEQVGMGQPIGIMGYSGAGLGRHRAHLHLEVALMANQHYPRWHEAFHGGPSPQGVFFGQNLVGINPSELLLELRENPEITFSEFVQSRPVGYQIAIPGQYPLDILQRYPWLAAEGVSREPPGPGGAWVVSFTREGVPIEVDRQPTPVEVPEVVSVAEQVRRDYLATAGYLVRGGDGEYRLTRAGLAYAGLLATTEDHMPRWW
jgi:murein DD-endopeptidase MepM/ murein hydrolase activator NlpD